MARAAAHGHGDQRRDARIGGTWACTHTHPDGHVYGFRAVLHHVVPNAGIVQTFAYDGFPGHVSLGRVVLEDLVERT